MKTEKVDVLVLGAGIVGMSVAHSLQTNGRKVTVIDKGPVGYGCSYGNAGWVTPCFAMPLPQPGMLIKSFKWLLDPESPLYIKPEANPLLMKWLYHFTLSMTHKKMNQSIEVLAEISKESLKLYKDLSKDKKDNFGFEQKGLLMVSAFESGLKAARDEMQLMAKRGIEGRELNQKEVLNLEPALRDKVIGGVYFPTEAHVEPLQAVQKMAKDFEAMGGQLKPFTEVYDFELQNGRIQKVITTKGIYEADLVVMAMGTWSKTLAKFLRTNIPIMGGKGYSLIIENFDKKPEHPIMIVEKKIAVTPRADSVRVAGTLELVDSDDAITPRRVNAILRGAHEYIYVSKEPQVRELWRGLRPCTPDGVPMIGFSKKWKNLFYCTGHQMLGLQSAPGSARLAKELIFGETPYVNAAPFRPERF